MDNQKQKLELRMYGFVAYNLGSVQKGIQFGHAVVEYGKFIDYIKDLKDKVHIEDSDKILEQWNEWRNNHKTFIVLDGGSTNKTIGPNFGTLNQLYQEISVLTPAIPFYEPDLGDQLSAFVFILDERVFNREKWEFDDYDIDGGIKLLSWFKKLSKKEQEKIKSLRQIINGKRLAQ